MGRKIVPFKFVKPKAMTNFISNRFTFKLTI